MIFCSLQHGARHMFPYRGADNGCLLNISAEKVDSQTVGVSRLTPNLCNAHKRKMHTQAQAPPHKAKTVWCACVYGFLPSWSREPLKEKKKKKTEK